MKRRLLRITLMTLAVVGFTVYFAFSTFLFSPLEGDYEYDVATLIPRDVDFFVAKAGLADDFTEFPELAGLERFERTRAARAWRETPVYQETVEPALIELRAALSETLARIPIDVDPLSIFGGRDLAIAGRFQGADLAAADWAVYARTNWMGKLALGLLHYPGLLGLEAQGLSVEVGEDVVSLSGGQLARPVHLTRVLDVLVASSSRELAEEALALDLASGADSFGQSARYADSIERPARDGDELEYFVDYLTLAEEFRLTGRWPDTRSQDLAPAFLGRLFQTAALKEVVGVARFDDGVGVELRGEFSSELVTDVQKKLYRTRHFDKDRFRSDVARFAPVDAGLFVYLHGDIGDLLSQLLDSLDAATLGLVEDQVRSVWGYGTADTLIEDVEQALHNRLALLVRPNDYPDDPEGPPHNDDPVPAWGLALWAEDVGKLTEIQRRVINHQSQFGLQGREPGSNGVFTNEVAGGFTVYEFWSQQIPGTGHVAMSLPVNTGDFFFVGNSFRVVEQLLKTYYEGAPSYPRLTDNPTFQGLVYEGLDSATMMAWANPSTMGDTLRPMLRLAAERGVVVDMRLERARLEGLVLREDFGGRSANQLTSSERSSLENKVDHRMRELVDRVHEEQVPALYRRYERNVTLSEVVDGALLQMALYPRRLELGLGVSLAPVRIEE